MNKILSLMTDVARRVLDRVGGAGRDQYDRRVSTDRPCSLGGVGRIPGKRLVAFVLLLAGFCLSAGAQVAPLSVSIDEPPEPFVEIQAGETVSFAATASGGAPPYSFQWTFPGGEPASSTVEDPGAVTFTEPGTYTVTVTVFDTAINGEPASTSDSVTVDVLPPPLEVVIDEPPEDVEINVGKAVTFAATVTGGVAPYSFAWQFPGGEPASSTVEDPGAVTFTESGEHMVSLTVTDARGTPVSATRVVTVIAPLEVIIDEPPGDVGINVGEAVTFAATVTGGVAPYSFAWQFPGGEPASSTVEDPGAVTFTEPGVHTVTVTVFDTAINGEPASASDSVTVTVLPPPLEVVIDEPSGDVEIQPGETVTFAATVTGGVAPYSFAWEFPGGEPGSSTAENPGAVTFTETGVHTVSLTVTDAEEMSVSATRTVTVTETPLPPESSLERSSGQDFQVADLSQRLTLAVRLLSGDNQPVSGVPVEWSLRNISPVQIGDATLNDSTQPVTVRTDANGEAGVAMQTGTRPANYEVIARTPGANDDGAVTFRVEVSVAGNLDRDTPEGAAAEAIDNTCPALAAAEELTPAQRNLLATCSAIIEASSQGADVTNALRQISPSDVSAQTRTGQSFALQQLNNIGARLGALRSGARSISMAGLNLNMGDQALPGGLFEGMLPRGGAAGDTELLGGRLGVFVNGSILIGDRDRTNREDGFDFDTYGITGGADYRFTDQLVFGLALGLATTDVNVQNSGGQMDADSYTISAYGNFYPTDNLYIDGILSFGSTDYDIERRIRYSLTGVDLVDDTAKSSPDGDQFSVSLGSGYEFNLDNGFSLTLDGRLSYLKLQIDKYQETGADASGLNLVIDDQELNSFTATVGGQVSRAFSMNWGVLIPQLRLEWEHEFRSGGEEIKFTFADAPNTTFFSYQTDDFDKNYFRLGAGVSGVFSRGRQAFFQYETTLGRDDYTDHRFTAGLRFEF